MHKSGPNNQRLTKDRWPTDDKPPNKRSSSSCNKKLGNARQRLLHEEEATTTNSWSEDLEDTAARKTAENWSIVESAIFENEDKSLSGQLWDECVQWREQEIHLRIRGKKIQSSEWMKTNGSSSSSNGKTSNNSYVPIDCINKTDELTIIDDDIVKELSYHSIHGQSRKQAKEQVLDYLFEFISTEMYREMEEIEEEKRRDEEGKNLNDDFSEFLKIAPAPTTVGKNPLANNSFYYSVNSNSNNNNNSNESPNKDKEKVVRKNSMTNGRHKLGTVFKEKVLVNPIAYVFSTKESFTTLRRTPIYFINDVNEQSNAHRNEKFRRKSSSVRRTSAMVNTPHHIQLRTSPSVPIWSKNVKLAPIDTSRLPSSKKRPPKTAEGISRRNKSSLSPIITRSVNQTSPRSSITLDSKLEGLEIRGSHIKADTSKTPVKSKPRAAAKHIEAQ